MVGNRILRLLFLLLVVSQIVKAERLPIKTYTTSDGLAHNVVNRVEGDSRGFLWFCTREGLSRFDGYSFTNYGTEQGLPSAIVNDLLETRGGEYWVATAGGLCRFNPLGKQQSRINSAADSANPIFGVYSPGEDARSKYILSLFQDRAGVIWCGTGNGLYRIEVIDREVKFTPIDLGMPAHFESRFIDCLLEDREGALWIGSRGGLYRRWPDARVEVYTHRDGLPDTLIHSLLEDRSGHIWVGTAQGWLFRLVPDPVPGGNVVARAYSEKDGLPTRWINQLFQAKDGVIWAGSSAGLIEFIPTPDDSDFRFRAYDRAHGFNVEGVASIAEDRNGNIWAATSGGGVAKVSRSSFTAFGRSDGFFWASTIFETRAGELLVIGGPSTEMGSINRFDGESFNRVRVRCLETIYTWGWNQTALQDRAGEWWIASALGVYRFPKVTKLEQLAKTRPKAIYTTRDGLAANVILRLFEDSRGDVWIGSAGHGTRSNGLSRWERGANVFHHYTEMNSLPRLDRFYVSSFTEDRTGNLWIGFSGDGGLVRYRDGVFTVFTLSDGVPPGQIRNMLVDKAGRLWLATTRGGLSRIDDPGVERPTFFAYTTANGLSSNEITAVSEDDWGRIYIGTGRGIDRLDPATERVKHYQSADGLPLGQIEGSLRDRQGRLWFSSFATGLVRFVPEPDPPPVPPAILITGLRVAGDSQPISALGEVALAPIELGPYRNQLQIDFVALGFSPGEGLRYQYRLEGAGQEWSPLTEQRSVTFANLAPGSYQFLVSAVDAAGVFSEVPASVSFRILSPIWQRWWFAAIVASLVGLIAFALYRYRIARLLDLERVRTRIATDLHDDIGSSLSQIAIMSEVVRQKVGAENKAVIHPLSVIAGTSRELVDSMADIVWAINPKRDHLIDLTERMRQFAGDLLAARNIEFTFAAPDLEGDTRIETDVRREVFLIFKEAINNSVRHSECSTIEIGFGVSDNQLMLKVKDNGGSFDNDRASGGHGLASMKRRAETVGGTLEILTEVGRGTTVTLQAPLRGRRLRRMRITT
jgi:ligand-binding sensor domain-containing protein/signal transduction histidine kinase